ncbi:hypothetical protein E4K72_16195 [Oxalobacteraceae bacterium OM1]|nr:hypothetical protein E4K72_16195 [Oxalobacteraceae bacterium OM1]
MAKGTPSRTRALLGVVAIAVVIAAQGCGGAGERSESLLAGTWDIDANKLVQAACGIPVGGVRTTLDVAIQGDTVTALREDPTPAPPSAPYTGRIVPGGFTVSGQSAGTNATASYVFTVTGIGSDGSKVTGVAEYAFQLNNPDGSNACSFKTTGVAIRR